MDADAPLHASTSDGLTAAEAAALLARHGPNTLRREAGRPAWKLLVDQLKSPLIALLAGAAVISGAMREVADAVAISAILVLNALVGFFQEHKAERAVLALRSMTSPRARVRRDGRTELIASSELVPGDLLMLEAGDVVGADARLLSADALFAQEAALTGESLPVAKSAEPAPEDAPLAERADHVFLATSIVAGTGRARVEATGMATELGKIAHLLQTTDEGQTPLQLRLAKVSRTLLLLSAGVVGLVVAIGLVRGEAPLLLLLAGISLAVAAVPEGLPAVVTIALAVGVQRMAERSVLVRRLPAVETLGCATVICTDKTGTLTTGQMKVRRVWAQDELLALRCGAACSDAELDATAAWGTGDPTEVAILVAAAERGISRPALEASAPRVKVQPFDTGRRRMSILRADGVLYVKGALEALLPLCGEVPAGVEEAHEALAAQGLRVLAVAQGRGPEEQGLTLVGLLGLADPPRPEAIAAVAAARRAGIKTVMITGDHPRTAHAIARELGILEEGPAPDGEPRVHARATPEQKLEIIRRWRARGDVVAMTGDGVNDAPALRQADVGIAMGRTGTEVTREASDMVLADDNFASIVAAVRQGRAIFDNIRKTLVYLLGGNTSELLVMLGASLLGLPLPLMPLQLLWINLVTDGLPALALVLDPPEADVLERPPRLPAEPLLGRPEWKQVLAVGALESTAVLAAFALTLRAQGLEAARTMAFSALVCGEVLRAIAARSRTRLFWEVGAGSNLRLLAVVVVTLGLQLLLPRVAFTRELFDVGGFTWADGAVALGVGLIPVSVLEGAKLWRRGKAQRSPATAGSAKPPSSAT